MKKGIFKLIMLFCVLILLTGCDTGNKKNTVVPVAEKPSYITCFGVVEWKGEELIDFPFDIYVLDVIAQNGQIAGEGDVLFTIDMNELILNKELLLNELEILEYSKDKAAIELEVLNKEHELYVRGAEEFDRFKVMELLSKIAADGDLKARKSLINTLDDFGLLSINDELISYVKSGDTFSFEVECPFLMEIERGFESKALETSAEIYNLSSQINRIEADIYKVKKRIDAVVEFINEGKYKRVKLDDNGEVSIAVEGFLLDNIYIRSNRELTSQEPVLTMVSKDFARLVCYVEEQLIGNIYEGESAQLSLYGDSSVVEIGTVVFVSKKAVIRNGETVVEVVVEYDGDSFLPGYNVIARIGV